MIPIIISLVIALSWLINRGILIAYKKDLLKQIGEWLNKRAILAPTFAVFFLPIFTAYLTFNPVPDIIKLILPLITFVIGQFLGKYEKQQEIRNKQVEVLQILRRKLSIALDKIYKNKIIIEIELDSISDQDRGFVEERLQIVDKIIEDYSRLDLFLTLTNENFINIDDLFNIRILMFRIDEFNEGIEERRNYIAKCRELTSNSVDQYYHLLKYTDQNLLKLAQDIEQLNGKISKIDIKL